ncbi:hypothetical protein [Tropicimonas sp. IMCC6043]|uniref:hypothetical protein n=1 Tax=Tropicimonas sp. IMCC6043 TaxID=2510645 RepID=UPI00101DC2D4|nr:hypothetical protein [Tropicimonas sp. IMCC6043]RYH09401.1 hypothetical protein EU800_12035 [Tropicimonas sp. IMCC6043]
MTGALAGFASAEGLIAIITLGHDNPFFKAKPLGADATISAVQRAKDAGSPTTDRTCIRIVAMTDK